MFTGSTVATVRTSENERGCVFVQNRFETIVVELFVVDIVLLRRVIAGFGCEGFPVDYFVHRHVAVDLLGNTVPTPLTHVAVRSVLVGHTYLRVDTELAKNSSISEKLNNTCYEHFTDRSGYITVFKWC